MRICVLELVCHDYEHAAFNASFIEWVVRQPRVMEVSFLAEAGHLRCVQQLISCQGCELRFDPIEIPQRQSSFVERLKKEWAVLRHERWIRTFDAVILSSAEPSTIMAVDAFARLGGRSGMSVLVVLHSVVASLWGWRSRNPIVRGTNIRFALSIASRRIKFIVLESHIRKALLEALPALGDRVVLLPHPVVEREFVQGNANRSLKQPVRFGFLGAGTYEKGFDIFLTLAAKVKERVGDKASFSAVGPIRMTVDQGLLNVLEVGAFTDGLPRSEFLRLAKDLDYVICPLRSHYQYAASGSIVEALALGCPLVGSRSPGLKNLEMEFGDIGYLGDVTENFVSMVEIVKQLPRKRYQAQMENIRRAGHSRRPSVLSKTHQVIG